MVNIETQNRTEYAAFTRPLAQEQNTETGESSIFNKREAFRKCVETKEFKSWHKMETARRLGHYHQDILDKDLKIEYYKPHES